MSKRLLYIGQAPTTAAAAYTSTSVKTSIFSATVCNPTGTADALSVWVVPSGASQVDANKIYDGISIPANDQAGLELLVNVTLNDGDAIYTEAATSATALTVQLSGAQE